MPLFDVKIIQSYYCSQHKHKVKKQHRFCTLLSFNLTPFDWFCFSVFSKSRSLLLLSAYHYIIFLLRLRVTIILYEFVPTIKVWNDSIYHIFTDLKSKIQFGSVDLEFWVFNWYVLDLKVDLRNATTLNGGIFFDLLESSPIKLLLKTHNFKHDIFPSVHGIERWC